MVMSGTRKTIAFYLSAVDVRKNYYFYSRSLRRALLFSVQMHVIYHLRITEATMRPQDTVSVPFLKTSEL